MQQDADDALLCELCLERGGKAAPNSLKLDQPYFSPSWQQLHSSCRPEEHGSDAQSIPQPGTDDSSRPCTSDQTIADGGVRPACQGVTASTGMGRAAACSRLRILCLHGFRQSGSGLKGRTAALARKLADLAELTYVDAPHPLPFVLKHSSSRPCCDPSKAASGCTDCSEQNLQSSDRVQQQKRTAWDQSTADASSMPADVCHGNVNELPESLTDSGTHGISAQQNGAGCLSGQAPDSGAPCTGEGGMCRPTVSREVEQKEAGLPGSQMQTGPRRFRRAWLLEPAQLPVSQVCQHLLRYVATTSEDCVSQPGCRF